MPLSFTRFFLTNPITIISVLYWIISFVLFYHYGVRTVNDTYRYFQYAEQLKGGFYIDPHNIWYIGYVCFIFIIKWFGGNSLAIVIIQYILSYIAVLALYKGSFILFSNKEVAFIASVGYIFFIEMLSWNSYLICESLFCSLICISLCCLVYVSKVRSFWKYLVVTFVLLWTIVTKPTGIALLVAIVVAILSGPISRFNRWVRLGVYISSAIVFVLVLNKMLGTYLIIENYMAGEVVYGITTLQLNDIYAPLIVEPPQDLYIPDVSYSPLVRVLLFAVHHPWYWIKLFLTKLVFLLTHVRPYWSWVHNSYSLVFLGTAYVFIIKTLFFGKLKPQIIQFAMVYLAMQVVSVCLTSVDWDGRFLLPMLPVILPLMALGAIQSFHPKKEAFTV